MEGVVQIVSRRSYVASAAPYRFGRVADAPAKFLVARLQLTAIGGRVTDLS